MPVKEVRPLGGGGGGGGSIPRTLSACGRPCHPNGYCCCQTRGFLLLPTPSPTSGFRSLVQAEPERSNQPAQPLRHSRIRPTLGSSGSVSRASPLSVTEVQWGGGESAGLGPPRLVTVKWVSHIDSSPVVAVSASPGLSASGTGAEDGHALFLHAVDIKTGAACWRGGGRGGGVDSWTHPLRSQAFEVSSLSFKPFR